MRYVLCPPTVQFSELEDQIRVKFGVRGSMKLKIRDEEGDLVVVGDQEDLDMAILIAKAGAAKERAEMGKMEVWVVET